MSNDTVERGATSHLTQMFRHVRVGDRVDFTIDGGIVERIYFDEITIKDELARGINAQFNLLVIDNPESLVEMFLVKHIRLRASA